MNQPEHEPVVAAALGALLADQIEQTAVNEAASRARLLTRAAALGPRRTPSRRWWRAAPVLAAAAGLVWWQTPGRLRYEIVGSTAVDSYVSAPSDRPVVVHFSDETLLQVAASSRLRIEDTTREGARILLERGTAAVHVVHRPSSHWTFAAGPFEVLVTGTRFDLNWNPSTEILELQLREGSVEIRTPFASVPVALRGGQTFRSDLHARSMTTTDLAPEASAVPAPSAVPASPALPSASSEPSASSAPNEPGTGTGTGTIVVAPAAARAWPKLVAAGEFNTLLEQAHERGVASCLRLCSPSELSALADAARYTGKVELAEQSLDALRARFSHTAEARAAIFLLGRIAEGQGSALKARDCYDTYLNESPSGAYAAEALAGKMRAVSTSNGRAAAQPLAREYLKRYPTGVHAGTARGILADQ